MVSLSDAGEVPATIIVVEETENSEFLVSMGHPRVVRWYTVRLDRSGLVVREHENKIRKV